MADGDHLVRAEKEPGPIGRLLIALMLGTVALFCLAVGFHWVNADPSPGVPRWLVGLVGIVCALGSVVALLPRDSRASAVLAAMMVTCFAATAAWIALGPGDRGFGMSFSFGSYGSGGDPGEWIGRMAFGFGALMCALFAFLMWRHALRPRPPEDESR